MKKYIALILACFVYSIIAIAQESKFVGTWRGIKTIEYVRDQKRTVEDWQIILRIVKVENKYNLRVKQIKINEISETQYWPNCIITNENDSIIQFCYWKRNVRYADHDNIHDEKKYYHLSYSAGSLILIFDYMDYIVYDAQGKNVLNYVYKQEFYEEPVILYQEDDWFDETERQGSPNHKNTR